MFNPHKKLIYKKNRKNFMDSNNYKKFKINNEINNIFKLFYCKKIIKNHLKKKPGISN